MIQPKKIIAAILLILGSIFGGYQVADDVFFNDGTLVTEDYTILKSADFTRPIQADTNYTVTGLSPATEYNLSVTTWNGSQQTSKAYILALTNTTEGIFVNPDFVGDEGEFVNKWRSR